MEMLGNKLRVKKYGSDKFSRMTFRSVVVSICQINVAQLLLQRYSLRLFQT